MPRIRKIVQTEIYWLVDVRPETLASGWSTGKPFYCGKTIESLKTRLSGHKGDARRHPSRPSTSMVLACGSDIRIDLMETVDAGCPWPESEKDWIAVLRHLNPDCTNVSDGGYGMTGYKATEETRAKMSKALRGKKLSPERIEQMRIERTGTTHGPEARRKLSMFNKGKSVSQETRELLSRINIGKKHSAETRAKLSAVQSGRTRKPHSEETKKKIGDRHRGRKHTAAFCRQMSERRMGKKHSPEHRAAISAGNKKAYAEGRRVPIKRKVVQQEAALPAPSLTF
jgi:hypothetical protein